MKRPPRILPRGLSRLDAAAYIGVSAPTFDKLVADGTIDAPIRIRGRKIYDRHKIDRAVFGEGAGNDESDGLADLRKALGVSGNA